MAAEFTATNGRPCAFAVIVDRARNKLFSGAALAVDQDRSIAFCDAADGLVNLLHGGGVADEPALVLFPHFGAEHVYFFGQPPDVDCLAHEDVDFVEVERFGDVIEGASPHRLDGVLHRGLGSHDDDRCAPAFGLDLVERLKPAHPGHADIHEHDRNVVFLEPGKRFGPVFGEHRLEPLFFERLFEHPPDAFVVIDYEYFFFGHDS